MVVLLVVGACGGGDGSSTAVIGDDAPTFSAPALDGGRLRLADYEGKTVLLNFWASWCIPCRTEFPLLRSVHGRGDVAVVGVVFRDSASAARDFMRDQEATWRSAHDPKGEIAAAYGVRRKPGIPVTYVVGPDGVVRAKHLGELSSRADVDALLRAVTPT